jgi:ubiquinone biosynthesis protein
MGLKVISLRKIGGLSRNYRHLPRYRHIIAVLLKYGFDEAVDSLGIDRYLELGLNLISRQRPKGIERLSREKRFRMVLEELGPTFIKMGQMGSTRSDLFSPDLLCELTGLQDNVKPFSFEKVKETIEEELGKSLEDVFSEFEEIPIASASIGQVHRAKLKTGEDLAIKVQRPEIQKIIEADLEIMLHLASLMERHVEEAELQCPTRIISEFGRSLEKEIDYTTEASNLERFGRQFQGDSTVYVPKVFHHISTSRLLVMEYIDGIKSNDISQLDKAGLDRKIITERGTDLFLKQIFEYGFFHADPHAGNLFVLPNNIMCYLDYGMMGYVDLRTRENFAELLQGFFEWDETKAVRGILKLVEYEDSPNIKSLERDVADLMGQYLYKPLKEIQIGKIVFSLFNLLSRHQLRIPQGFYLMIRAMSAGEGLGLVLDPEFDMFQRMGPFVMRARSARFDPKRLTSEVLETGIDLISLILEIPREFRDLIAQAKRGKVKTIFELKGLELLIDRHDKGQNRRALSNIIAALIIGAALVIHAKIPPFLFGISLVGLIGFLVAGIMGLWLLIAIFRSG